MSYEDILVRTHGRVGLIALNRPRVFNTLNDALMDELGTALLAFDTDTSIGAIVITGGERAFAAGVDISTMADYDFTAIYKNEHITHNQETIYRIRKLVIAAVAGYAFGGGCELAMMCDIILVADTAKFGQPEIKLDTIPGADGTQRLPHAVSKAKTMGLCLTARMTSARGAERTGLISRVIPAGKLLDEATQATETTVGFSLPTVMMIKESISTTYETSLSEGVHLECRLFHSTSATEDQKKGMRAFIEKHAPTFKHQ